MKKGIDLSKLSPETGLSELIAAGYSQQEIMEALFAPRQTEIRLIADKPKPLSDSDEMIDLVQSEDEALEMERASIRDFAYGERIAHNFAYQHASRRDGDLVEITGTDKQTFFYKIKKLPTSDPGIICEILTPAAGNSNSDVIVSFTGTKDIATIKADLQVAPAERTFRAQEDSFLKHFGNAVREVYDSTGKKPTIKFTGHSLGGSLAQLGTTAAMRAIALVKSKSANPDIKSEIETSEMLFRSALGERENTLSDEAIQNFELIDSIEMYTWNAAGVIQPVGDLSNNLVKPLSDFGVKIKARFGMVGGDGVARTGDTAILNDANEHADIEVIKMDIGEEDYYRAFRFGAFTTAAGIGAGLFIAPFMPALAVGAAAGGLGILGAGGLQTATAHTAKHFNGKDTFSGMQLSYELLRNNSEESRVCIQKRLRNKSKFLKNPAVRAIQRGLERGVYRGNDGMPIIPGYHAARSSGAACSSAAELDESTLGTGMPIRVR